MLLSIIIPVYNAEHFVTKCLTGIYQSNLSLNDFEVICVDDCSTDNSCDVITGLQVQYPNLKLLRHSTNLRAGGARNSGVRVAEGEYIIFIDADDYFHTGSLKKACDHLKGNPDVDILVCNFARELPEKPNNIFVHKYHSAEKLSPESFIALNRFVPCGPCQWFFRRSLMIANGVWFRENTISEDVDWTHRLILCAQTVQYQPILLSHYVIVPKSQTALSYAKPGNVYAYMKAGSALFLLKEQYETVGQKEFLCDRASGYIQQGLKYYLAMQDSVANKVGNIKENIPEDLALYGRWEHFRKHPYVYSYLTNILCPVVRLLLKLKAKFYLRGIKLR